MFSALVMAAMLATEPDPVACRLPDGSTIQCVWRYEIGKQPQLVVELSPRIFRDGFE